MAGGGKFDPKNSRAAKLTPSKVMEIRHIYAQGGCSQGALARAFQVSAIQIGRIIRGESWQNMPLAPPSLEEGQASFARFAERHPELIPAGPPTAVEKLTAQVSAKRAEDHRADGWLDEIAGAEAPK